MSGRSRVQTFLTGALGGAAAVAAGTALIATGVVDLGADDPTVQAPGVATALAQGSPRGAVSALNRVYERTGPGVVFIQARRDGSTGRATPFGSPEGGGGGTATGSGFVLDRDGFILTNSHVVDDARDVSVRFDEGGRTLDARVVGADPSTDLALLKVDPGEARLTPVPLGRSADVRVGDTAIALGNPLGFEDTLTTGVISALERQIQAPNGFSIDHVIQTDASINQGNSGGPLLDAEGRVIGINSQIATGGTQGSVGIGFAVPIDTAKEVLPALREGRRVERAYLGITSSEVTPEVARELRLPAEAGALVQNVAPGGPAARAGLRAGNGRGGGVPGAGGDLIVRVDGRDVREPEDLVRAIADDRPGERVRVEYFREGERRSAEVELGVRPTESPQG